MGLNIKYWTNRPVTVDETETPVKGKRTRKSPAKKVTGWTEVTVDVTSLGMTPEFWFDEKNEDAKEAILKAIPGINTEFGVGSVRY